MSKTWLITGCSMDKVRSIVEKYPGTALPVALDASRRTGLATITNNFRL